MSTDDVDEFAHHDAAFVLGALSPEDERAFTEHLRTCDACAASVAALSSLPPLLRSVSADDAARAGSDRGDPAVDLFAAAMRTGRDPAPAPPSSILPGVLARASRARRRRRVAWAASGLAAAAAVVLVLAVAVGGLGRTTAPEAQSSPAAVLAMTAVDQTQITATAQLTPVRWGTRIELLCTYADTRYGTGGSSLDDAYSLVVTDAAGRSERTATWTPISGRTLTVPAATALTTAEIVRVDVEAPDGTVVLTLDPPT